MGRRKNLSEAENFLSKLFLTGSLEETIKFKEYVGPLRIHSMGSTKGRGLRLHENVSRGQILVISNSMATAHRPLDAFISSFPPADVLDELARELALWSSKSNVKYPLTKYLCSKDSQRDMEVPPIRFFDNRESHSTKPDGPPVRLDLKDLRNVASHNFYYDQTTTSNPNTLPVDVPGLDYKFEKWGMWLVPSFVNHSCIPSCSRMVVGKTMIIRAARNMAKGEEITLPYYDVFRPVVMRDTEARRFNFRCECNRCILEWSAREIFEGIEKRFIETERDVWDNILSTTQVSLVEEHAKNAILVERGIMKICDMKKIDRTDVQLHWIRASFLGAYISLHRVQLRCETRSGSSIFSEIEVKCSFDISFAIVRILNGVHPGTPFGRYILAVSLLLRQLYPQSVDYLLAEEKAKEFYTACYGPNDKIVHTRFRQRNFSTDYTPI